MDLTIPQAKIAEANNRFRVINCGRRFGKTTLAVEEIKGKAYCKQNRIAYIAPTYQQARDIAWEMLKKELRAITKKVNESRLELLIKNQNSEESIIVLRGWESIETLRGQQFDFIVIDEVASMRNFWLAWQEVIRPTLTDTRGEVMFISTPKGFNHFYDLFNLEATDKNFKSFHFTTYDNPFIDPEELEEAKGQMTEDRFAQEYLADFRKQEGLVYKEFNREKHLYDELPPATMRKVAGIDFGYTNPAAVLEIHTDGEWFYIENEWYKKGRTEAQIAEYTAQCGFKSVYPDPESPSAIEELRRKGLNVREVVKGKDSVASGIQRVRELLLSGQLQVNRRCLNTINEFEMYCYEEDEPDRDQKEKPFKANDHCLVGDTMITMAYGGELPLKNIKIGDMVKTEHGINKVLLSRLTRKNADIYEIELSNGYKLKGTGDHKIFTNRGKIAIDALRYDDIIKVLSSDKISLWKRQSSLIIKNIIGMASIIRQLGGMIMVERDYIKQYGYITKDQSHRDFIFTTRTEMQETINYLILDLLKLTNIYQNTLEEIGQKKSLEKKSGKISKISDTLLKSGTHQIKESNGTLYTVKELGQIGNQLVKIAKYVEKNIKHISPQDQDFAITIVKRKRCGKEDVYNLTVVNEHNYYANGILVKNCLDAIRYVISMIIEPINHERDEIIGLYENRLDNIDNELV